jgi:hypothetical protein
MDPKKCKHCGEIVRSSFHSCSVTGEDHDSNDDGSFLISAAIAAATDSALLGGLLGGDMLGGVVGDLLDGDLFD